MGLLDFLQPQEDPKLALLIDTNHKLTLQLSTVFENYVDQISDLKARVERLEDLVNDSKKRNP